MSDVNGCAVLDPPVATIDVSVSPEPVEQPTADDYRSSVSKVANLIIAAYDGNSVRTHNLKIGNACLTELRRRKKLVGDKFNKSDFDRYAADVAAEVRATSSIESAFPRVDDFCRFAAFVEAAIKAGFAKIDKVSYGTVVNYLSPAVSSFSKEELTCEIRESWSEVAAGWIIRLTEHDTTARLTAPRLKEEIAEHKAELEKKRLATIDPSKAAEAENKAKSKKKIADQASAKVAIQTTITEALQAGALAPAELAMLVEKTTNDAGHILPTVGANPATISPTEAETFVKAMFAAGNVDAMASMFGMLAKLLEMAKKAAA